jgi:hypothetical protein
VRTPGIRTRRAQGGLVRTTAVYSLMQGSDPRVEAPVFASPTQGAMCELSPVVRTWKGRTQGGRGNNRRLFAHLKGSDMYEQPTVIRTCRGLTQGSMCEQPHMTWPHPGGHVRTTAGYSHMKESGMCEQPTVIRTCKGRTHGGCEQPPVIRARVGYVRTTTAHSHMQGPDSGGHVRTTAGCSHMRTVNRRLFAHARVAPMHAMCEQPSVIRTCKGRAPKLLAHARGRSKRAVANYSGAPC